MKTAGNTVSETVPRLPCRRHVRRARPLVPLVRRRILHRSDIRAVAGHDRWVTQSALMRDSAIVGAVAWCVVFAAVHL